MENHHAILRGKSSELSMAILHSIAFWPCFPGRVPGLINLQKTMENQHV